MLGNALMVAPVLEQGAASVSAYFPQGTWYSLYDHALVDASSGGAYRPVTVRCLSGLGLCHVLMMAGLRCCSSRAGAAARAVPKSAAMRTVCVLMLIHWMQPRWHAEQ